MKDSRCTVAENSANSIQSLCSVDRASRKSPAVQQLPSLGSLTFEARICPKRADLMETAQ